MCAGTGDEGALQGDVLIPSLGFDSCVIYSASLIQHQVCSLSDKDQAWPQTDLNSLHAHSLAARDDSQQFEVVILLKAYLCISLLSHMQETCVARFEVNCTLLGW